MNKYNLLKNKDNIESGEIKAKGYRRSYTVSYKLNILERAKNCIRPGQLGELLRKEGLTSSTLHGWRVAQSNGLLRDTKAIKRGPEQQLRSPQKKILFSLQKENASLKRRLEKALAIVDLQKKIAEILSQPEELINGEKSCS